MRPGVSQAKPGGGFLGGDFCWCCNNRAQRVAHDAGIFPVGEVNSPEFFARLWRRQFRLFSCLPVNQFPPVALFHGMEQNKTGLLADSFPMVTAKTQYNLKNAKEYFEEHLCVGDYYDEGQRVTGQWFGVGAERLGLTSKVGAEAFLAPM